MRKNQEEQVKALIPSIDNYRLGIWAPFDKRQRQQQRHRTVAERMALHTAARLSTLQLTIVKTNLERRDREGSGDPGGVGEGDLPRPMIVDVDVGDGDPDEELLALDPSEPPYAVLLHEARDLRVVRHRVPNQSEPMLLLALLLQPDASLSPVIHCRSGSIAGARP
ncbi:hypothetical protein FH972_012351 [Carpinus fangiana]|uniref:Uncharacterized protein n=1 Tax=Carpinus fangiana TaxID=176857 RepID=A0A5N6R5W5_9ROSI|nr:hypothetical protein FH972_012351 [Carpinus fangiana]